jgi:hypothetical protein
MLPLPSTPLDAPFHASMRGLGARAWIVPVADMGPRSYRRAYRCIWTGFTRTNRPSQSPYRVGSSTASKPGRPLPTTPPPAPYILQEVHEVRPPDSDESHHPVVHVRPLHRHAPRRGGVVRHVHILRDGVGDTT